MNDQALEHKLPNELVQYWPGDNPNSGFVESIILEDTTTGGVVKVSVVDDIHHKIEELVGDADLSSKSDMPIVSNAPASPPATESPASPPAYPIVATSDVPSPSVSACPASPPLSPPTSPCSPPFHTHDSSTKKRSIECSKLRVEYQGLQHEVWHIRCNSWKDQDAPDIDMFMDLWKLVEEKLKSHAHDPGQKHKLVVHCTGGVGRTGTFITIDIAGQELKSRMEQNSTEEFSVEKIIQFLRSKRMNMVGSVPQYVFCHRAALKVLAEQLRTPLLANKPAADG